MNLIALEIILAAQATMIPENNIRKVVTAHGKRTEHYEFLDLTIFDSNFQDITYKVNDKRFFKNISGGYLGTTNNPSGFLTKLLKTSYAHS